MLPLSAASAMLSLRTLLRPDREPLSLTVAFRFPGNDFVGRLDLDGFEIERGEAQSPDLVFETDPTTFVTLVYGKRPLEPAEAAGRLRLDGDRELAGRFIACFALPPKLRAAAND